MPRIYRNVKKLTFFDKLPDITGRGITERSPAPKVEF